MSGIANPISLRWPCSSSVWLWAPRCSSKLNIGRCRPTELFCLQFSKRNFISWSNVSECWMFVHPWINELKQEQWQIWVLRFLSICLQIKCWDVLDTVGHVAAIISHEFEASITSNKIQIRTRMSLSGRSLVNMLYARSWTSSWLNVVTVILDYHRTKEKLLKAKMPDIMFQHPAFVFLSKL